MEETVEEPNEPDHDRATLSDDELSKESQERADAQHEGDSLEPRHLAPVSAEAGYLPDLVSAAKGDPALSNLNRRGSRHLNGWAP